MFVLGLVFDFTSTVAAVDRINSPPPADWKMDCLPRLSLVVRTMDEIPVYSGSSLLPSAKLCPLITQDHRVQGRLVPRSPSNLAHRQLCSFRMLGLRWVCANFFLPWRCSPSPVCVCLSMGPVTLSICRVMGHPKCLIKLLRKKNDTADFIVVITNTSLAPQ
jgi:hypothetical protein